MMPLTKDHSAEIAHFKNLVTARTDGEGKPKPGYRKNVEMLRAEIARLTALAPGGSDAQG